METKHIIIGLIVIIAILLIVVVGLSATLMQKTPTPTPVNTTNNSSIVSTNGSTNEPTTSTPTSESKTSNNEKQEKGDSLDRSGKLKTANSYQEEYEYEEVNEPSSSSSDGNYLSADDYYVSDMGFVISKHPNR